jgi:biotin carboxylase
LKRILLLGGSHQQVVAIETARRLGYYTILCDFLPDNPGRLIADQFYGVSTTDRDAVLAVAREAQVDGILAYASDPAAPIAASVAEQLGLPTNPSPSVDLLAHKGKFRSFLRQNGFCCPRAESFSCLADALTGVSAFKFPVMVKPVDSSGSKGVSCVTSISELAAPFSTALQNSRSGHIIVEEYIKMAHPYLIGGDCFIIDGQVVLWGLLNCHRDPAVNLLVPVGKSHPAQLSAAQLDIVKVSVQRLAGLLGLRFGGFNVELLFDAAGSLYIIEMGPRHGGNLIPELLGLIYGIDLVAAAVQAALGEPVELSPGPGSGYFASHNLHADRDGILMDIRFEPEIEVSIIRKVLYKKSGDPVGYFDGANKAIGIVFFHFNTEVEMLDRLTRIGQLITIIVT